MSGGASAAGRMKVYFESPIAVRRSEFRYAKCARQTFMGGGASAAGRMKVYFGNPIAVRRSEFLHKTIKIFLAGTVDNPIWL